MGDWIGVGEGLPGVGKKVRLIGTNNAEIIGEYALFYDDAGRTFAFGHTRYRKGHAKVNAQSVKYWQYIEPPKKEDKQDER
jgi:hypothetical protein